MNTAVPKAPSAADELEDAIVTITEKREEMLAKLNQELADLEALREHTGKGSEEVRTKVRAARRRVLGADDGKRAQQLKTQDVRVRMRVPADVMAQATPKMEPRPPKQGVSKIVVQGSIQRELSVIDARIVELFLDDGAPGQAPELVFLSDLRAGLAAVLKDLPEHGVLLGLVAEHVEQVQATLRDLGTGGVNRAKRFFDHDRELLGRLKAMLRADGSAKTGFPAPVDKLIQTVGRCKSVIDAGADVSKAARELEDALVAIHKELQERGFVAARSLLFSALR